MTFQIDTGNEVAFDPVMDACPDWLRDLLPETATRETIAQAMAEQLMADMRQPKTTDTVRKKLLARWAFLTALAELDPEQFDAVLLEYAERVTCTK